ncbi:hypothetical protein FRB94_003099 [Tulasnella sp. JGI-2019a]|nr:hypothetical protein FRB93_007971 [Tulasnella sp. JGI-2019a]KAG8986131.1 hypothetical protein FRB94_003099 [Tulasnella sp. JGI-2019a]
MSSPSSVLSTPSPEPSSNAPNVVNDDLPVNPKFATALEQLKLVLEKVMQFDEQDVCPTALVLLEFSRG